MFLYLQLGFVTLFNKEYDDDDDSAVFDCAVLDPFPTVTEVQVHRPTIGRHLVLECRPPDSYPSGHIYWGVSRPDSNQLKAIDNNDRVVLGYDGKIVPLPVYNYVLNPLEHCNGSYSATHTHSLLRLTS